MEIPSPDEQPLQDDPGATSATPPELGYDPAKPIMTLGDLLASPLVGMWKDRDDITDNLEFARSLGRYPRRYER